MTEASVTTGRATACRMPSGHIKLVVLNKSGGVGDEMIVEYKDACDLCSSLTLLTLIIREDVGR